MAAPDDRRQGPRWGGITSRLTVIFVLFAAVLLAVVGAFSFTSGRDSLYRATVSELMALSHEKQAALDTWTSDRRSDIVALAASPEVRARAAAFDAARASGDEAGAAGAQERLVATLAPRTGPGQPFQALLVIEPDEGQVIASTSPREEGTFKETRPFFVNGRHGPYIQSPYYSFALEGLAMTAAAPLRGPDGRLLAVLAGRLDIDELSRIIGGGTDHHRTDEAFLVNGSHLFVTQPYLVPDPVVLRRGVHTESVRRCLAQSSGSALADDYRGVPVIAVYSWLEQHQVCLIVKMDQDEAFAPVYAFGRSVLLIGGLALLGALLLAAALARTFTSPVLALQAGAAAIGAGRLDTRIAEGGRDELALLAREFNAMAARLAASEAELRSYAEDLERKVAERAAALVGAQEELRESEQRYRMLVEQAGDGIFISDASGRYVQVNDRGCAMLGYTLDELLEKNLRDLIPPEEIGLHPPRLDELRAGKTVIAERNLMRKDGKLLPVEITGKMLSNGQLQGIVRDITERKKAEQELRQLAAELSRSNADLQQFAYIASHDLQEPLRMVASYTQLLARRYKGRLDGDADEFIGFAVDGATRMQALINDLLAYSRVGTRGKPFEPVDCGRVVAQACANLRLAIEESAAAVDAGPLPVVCGDATQLLQLFQNLIANGIKFRGAEPPRIAIAAERRAGDWLFAVCDNGIGVEPQYAERIFIIFQRLHTRADYPGTGIGLAVCKKIVERHGGTIWVEPAPGRGARFCFTIPHEEGGFDR